MTTNTAAGATEKNGGSDYNPNSPVNKGELALNDLSSPSVNEAQAKKLKYPKQVFFIVGNEACERFSYYGMRTVLTLYLMDVLGYSDNNSTVIYHVFVCLCYFFPLLGGIIADTWLGKYRTVAYISVIYATGNVVLAISAVTIWNIPHKGLTFLGLMLIALGTGGIKPCVSSFGGDQFVVPEQERHLSTFFSVFYFAINAGSLISTFLTPELRSVSCLDYDTCYPLAFGVPAILMIVSVVFFVAGRPMYRVKAPEGNVVVEVTMCMWNAMVNKIKKSGKEKREHWLDYADAKYSEKLREDIRITLRSLLLFVPLPVFWALYEQQGSRWTIQADNMNGNLGGGVVVEPDQMQLINPLLILILLPLCESWIYPALMKMNLLTRPLQKMSIGGLLGAVAFVISGVVQIYIQNGPGYALSPSSGEATIHLLSTLSCNVTVNLKAQNETFILQSLTAWNKENMAVDGDTELTFDVTGTCASGSFSLTAYDGESHTYQLYAVDKVPTVHGCASEDDYTKNVNPSLRLMYHFSDSLIHNVTVKKTSSDSTSTTTVNGTYCHAVSSKKPSSYEVFIDGVSIGEQAMDVGGTYTAVFDDTLGFIATIMHANTVSIFWLVPQYFVITVAEVLLSVTGYEFAFTQAPISMKSLVSSIYLLTDSIGNLIVIFVAETDFLPSQSDEYFLFAAIMVAAMAVFIVLAMRYKYVVVADDDLPPQIEDAKNGQNDLEDKTRF